jgi:hypothetical protein
VEISRQPAPWDTDGGWLGPAPALTPPARLVEPTVAPLPMRRFADGDLQPPRRAGLVVALIVVAVLAVAGTAVLMLVEDRPGVGAQATTPSATPTDQPTTIITGSAEGAPRQVRLTDRGTSVTLTWADPSGGTVAFLVVGSGSGGASLETRQVERGGTSVTYSGLDRARNYCFVVGAVYAVDRVATAAEVCTRR